jgi:hypothetical protein
MDDNPQCPEEELPKAREILDSGDYGFLHLDPTLHPVTQLRQGIEHGRALLAGWALTRQIPGRGF